MNAYISWKNPPKTKQTIYHAVLFLPFNLSSVQERLQKKWCSHATCTLCFGQTIIPIKLIGVSFLSRNVLAKSLPPLNKTQCLLILGLNLSPRPKWDWIILSNLPSCILHHPWFPLHFYGISPSLSLWGQWCRPSASQASRMKGGFLFFGHDGDESF